MKNRYPMVNLELFGEAGATAIPLILVHGGAWDIPDEACEAHRAGLRRALEIGGNKLESGSGAIDVAAAVVAALESDGAFDAGRGAVLNRAGEVELDAGIMEGTARHFGSVAGIRHYENPILIAREIVRRGRRQFCFLAAEGAERFAQEAGFNRIENKTLICDRERRRYNRLQEAASFHTSHPFLPAGTYPKGTVGCVVRDHEGSLAAATSTGGTPFRVPGRVGDSPMPGNGFYASSAGAASATGWGEAIASMSLCYEAVRQLASEQVEAAAANVIRDLQTEICNDEGIGATGGIILLSRTGGGAFAYSTPRMARGGWQDGQYWIAV